MKTGMTPFVKWAGGKRQLVEKLVARMPEKFNSYHEPFVGAGAMVLYLKPENNTYINDTNEQLIHVYKTIRDDVDGFIYSINQMDAVSCAREDYYLIRKKYNEKIMHEIFDTEMASMFVYINKHCFNGMYRVNSLGQFNVPWNNKTSGASINEHNIRDISFFLNNNMIEIMNVDFELACEKCLPGDFVFFDSPYDGLSKTSNFSDYTKESFNIDDQKRLAKLFRHLTDSGVNCMLTNHSTDLINDLYIGYNIESIDVRRTINSDSSKRYGQELIVTNY